MVLESAPPVDISRVQAVVGDIPHMTPAQAQEMSDFIATNPVRDVLELGFRHGVSTCFMAEQLEIKGEGHVTTIDLLGAREAEPNVEELLSTLGLRDRVTVFYEPTSYIWRLLRMLEEDPTPRFDLCYLDGAHNWYVDGFAFFLVDRLLRPGGWIVLDDVDWTYAGSPSMKNTAMVLAMPEDERTTPQVQCIVDVLVRPHPAYGTVLRRGHWAFAQKTVDIAAELAVAAASRLPSTPPSSPPAPTASRRITPRRVARRIQRALPGR